MSHFTKAETKEVWFESGSCLDELDEEYAETMLHSPAEVVEYVDGSAEMLVKTSDGRTWRVDAKAARPVKDKTKLGVPDILSMNDLSEHSLMYSLRLRYDNDDFYTFVGPILISINPYKWKEDIYTAENMKRYKGAHQNSVPPHVFAVADSSYRTLVTHDADGGNSAAAGGGGAMDGGAMGASGRNQSVIISGESGAGKTEATKIIMQCVK